jgi:LmbE family N-acetylglucosaminyl deacetylase
MKKFWCTGALVLAAFSLAAPASAQKLRIIAFGAHPDDCDIRFGGTAAKFAALGHEVKFVTLTDGSAGHQTQGGGALSNRRRAETQEAARKLGIKAYEMLDNHDGELLPTLEARRQVIRKIREWNADVVLSPRPWDYHPDHRYTGVLVQDAAYMIMVPNICPETPSLRKNPVFMYYQDTFERPNPFRPDIAISIDDTMDSKVAAIASHVSQMFEWWPFMTDRLAEVPKDHAARVAWLRKLRHENPIKPEIRTALKQWYGAQGDAVRYAEAFEICEYGRRPTPEDLRQLFPFFPKAK